MTLFFRTPHRPGPDLQAESRFIKTKNDVRPIGIDREKTQSKWEEAKILENLINFFNALLQILYNPSEGPPRDFIF